MNIATAEPLGSRRSASAPRLHDDRSGILVPAIWDAFKKLHPRHMIGNPVMFCVEIVAALTTVLFLRDLFTGGGHLLFAFQINLWLWFTVCSRISRKRWRKDAARRRPHRCARRRPKLGGQAAGSRTAREWQAVPATQLKAGDIVLVEAGDLIPSDGDVIEGVASVNESAITGEFAPVIRESGGDRSAVTGGTQVISDWIKVKITAAQGATFLDRMIALVEGAERQKTPNEIALNILLAGMTLIFVFAVATDPELCEICRRRRQRPRSGGAVRHADPDHHRRAAVRHRHCRHGPACAIQRACDVRPRGRSRGRCRHAAARQDRHDHARQPAGDRISPPAGCERARPGRCRPIGVPRR